MDKLTTAACKEAALLFTALPSLAGICGAEEKDKASGNVADGTLGGGCSERGDGVLEHLVGIREGDSDGDGDGDIDADGDREFDDDEVEGVGDGDGDGSIVPPATTRLTLWL